MGPKITLSNKQKDLPLSLAECREMIAFLCSHLNIQTDEILCHFITDKKMRELHKLLFDDPSPTDCISVPIDLPGERNGYHVLGEIFVCAKVAKEYALAHGIDPKEELMRYVIHGLLHLIGYDDIDPKERKKMKKKEQGCLKILFEQMRSAC